MLHQYLLPRNLICWGKSLSDASAPEAARNSTLTVSINGAPSGFDNINIDVVKQNIDIISNPLTL